MSEFYDYQQKLFKETKVKLASKAMPFNKTFSRRKTIGKIVN